MPFARLQRYLAALLVSVLLTQSGTLIPRSPQAVHAGAMLRISPDVPQGHTDIVAPMNVGQEPEMHRAPAAHDLSASIAATRQAYHLVQATYAPATDPTLSDFDAALKQLTQALEHLVAGEQIADALTELGAEHQILEQLDHANRQQFATSPQSDSFMLYKAILTNLTSQLNRIEQLGSDWRQATSDAQRNTNLQALQSAATQLRELLRLLQPPQDPQPPVVPASRRHNYDPGPPRFVSPSRGQMLAAPVTADAGDLAATTEVQITQEITDLAKSLDNSPVAIYEYVRNGFAFDPYYGSLKGSTATLWTRSGNAYDLASLLLALLRAAGVPSHYVSGVVTIPIQQAKDWLGVTDVNAASALLRAGGIPATVVSADGQPTGLQIEHAWVEAFVSYDGAGPVWVPLDPSFKLRTYQPGIPLPASVTFDRDAFLSSMKSQLAYEAFEDQVRTYLQTTMPGKTLSDVPYMGEIIPEHFGVLPASLPYTVDAVLNRFSEVPDGLRHKVQIAASGATSAIGPPTQIPTTTLVLAQIALSRVSISFPPDPATSGLVRPALKVDGQTIATANLGMSTVFALEVRVGMIYPGQGLVEQVTHPADNYARGYRALIFDARQISDRLIATRAAKLVDALQQAGTPSEDQEAIHGELLNLAGLRYFQHLNHAAQSITGIYHAVLAPRVQEAMTYEAFRHPFLASWTQYKIDVRTVATDMYGIDGDASRSQEARDLYLMSGSGLENQIWEEITEEDSISTVKGLQYARATGQTVYRIDKSNISDLSKIQGLGLLALTIAQDIQAGKVIIIPGARLHYDKRRSAPWEWSGFVWISEDPTGKELTCYCISGSILAPLPTNTATATEQVVFGGATTCPLCDFIKHLTDALGVHPDSLASVGCPVMLGNGNMFHQFTDISVPTRGPPLQLTRTYNAQSTEDGPFGYGWIHNYSMHLVEDAKTGTVTFVNDSGGRYLFARQGSGYVHPKGVFLTLSKTGNGFTLRDAFGTTWSFTSAGRLTTITDRNGNAQTFGYDSSGRLTTVTDALGRNLTFSYNGAGKIIAIRDVSGRTWTYTYDGNGDLSSSTTPADTNTPASTTTYTYYTQSPWQHDLKTITDPRGQPLTFVYDSSDRAFQTIEPENKVTTFYYLPYRHETQVVTERGFVWSYYYDDEGFVTRIARPDGNVILRNWDDAGDLVSATDGLGYTTTMTYDSRGNMLTTTDPLGATTAYAYESSFSQITKITDARGNTTQFAVEPSHGNIQSATDPLGKVTSLSYDAFGNLTGVTDANNHTTAFAYDGNNYLTRMQDARGQIWNLTRDSVGHLTAFANPVGDTTAYSYDALDRLIATTDGEGNTQRFAYDGNGNLTRFVDANGKETQYTYDGLNNLTVMTDGLGNATRLGYQGPGCISCMANTSNLTSLTDANGNTRHYDYDELDRLVRETDALGRSKRYSYDAQDNLVGFQDEQGNRTQYSYDRVGRLLQKAFPDGSSESFSYDVVGNLLTAANAATTLSYTYDQRDQVTQLTDSALNRTIGYGYDNVGNRANLTAPDGRTLQYGYDANDNLTALTDFVGTTTAFSYDPADRLTEMAPQPGQPGVTTRLAYDRASRLTKLTNASPNAATTFIDFAYSYDKVGNLASMTANGLSAFGTLIGQTNYAYDNLYRLMGVTLPSGTAQSYAYDNAGNRRQSTTPAEATTQSFHDETDQLTFGGVDGNTTYTYDERGNLRTKNAGGQITRYSWDYENQLTRIDYADGSSSSYSYDAFGRRTSKTGRDGATVRYLYDGANILQEVDANGNTVATYVQSLGVDYPLSMTRDGQTSYYMYDRLGSVIGLSDGAGTLKASYVYDAWGNQTGGSDGGIANPYRYTGREYDAESGLYYYRARYYDPQAGRFISRDPIGLAGGVNGYVYVEGNPVNWLDPSGLCPADGIGGIGGSNTNSNPNNNHNPNNNQKRKRPPTKKPPEPGTPEEQLQRGGPPIDESEIPSPVDPRRGPGPEFKGNAMHRDSNRAWIEPTAQFLGYSTWYLAWAAAGVLAAIQPELAPAFAVAGRR